MWLLAFPSCVQNVWMEVQILKVVVTSHASGYCTLQDQQMYSYCGQSVQEVVPHSATARCAFCQFLNGGPETPYLQESFYLQTSHASQGLGWPAFTPSMCGQMKIPI
jgi:hypothetical protein